MNFIIDIIVFLVVMYIFYSSLKNFGRIEDFIAIKLGMPKLAEALWWIYPLFFLFSIIQLVQTVVPLIDHSITFDDPIMDFIHKITHLFLF